jgi:hypothetical protein
MLVEQPPALPPFLIVPVVVVDSFSRAVGVREHSPVFAVEFGEVGDLGRDQPRQRLEHGRWERIRPPGGLGFAEKLERRPEIRLAQADHGAPKIRRKAN